MGLRTSFIATNPSLLTTTVRGRVLAPRAIAEPPQDLTEWFGPGQKFGPQNPAHPAEKPYSNLELKKNKVEFDKKDSGQLTEPIRSELFNDEIKITPSAVNILKHHGSYQQQNRDLRSNRQEMEQSYQFMLRLKVPCGVTTPEVYRVLDDLATEYGQNDLKATTRMAWQLHGVKKGTLKHVVKTIREAGSNTLGGCGDINRNVMTSPATFETPAYQEMRKYASILAEVMAPQSDAFSNIFLDGEKQATIQYWNRYINGVDITELANFDNGRGIMTGHNEEPLYGKTYLPRKFKIAVTVEGDNSLDLYINDLGLVVIMEEDGKTLKGFNVMVGGGMGRTHKKETTFARAADHLGFVTPDKVVELCKAIIATQRDHGNREVRANARMKYLVHTLGIDKFRNLVEEYFGEKIEPMVPMKPWKFSDWLGWHDQENGKWFKGFWVSSGRIRDQGGVNVKTALRTLVDEINCDVVLTPSQNIIVSNISPEQKDRVDEILASNGIVTDEKTLTPLHEGAIACAALPLCGLAITEAERVLPQYIDRIHGLMDKMGLGDVDMIFRMTGCPNGCGRPYMAELGLVGSGPDTYQIWLGGTRELDGVGYTYLDMVKSKDLEATLEPVFALYKMRRKVNEGFGNFCKRVGKVQIANFAQKYVPGSYKDIVDGKNVMVGQGKNKSIKVDADLHARMKALAKKNKMTMQQFTTKILMEGTFGMEP
eukprot:CAMPEP_0184485386 /NCGR_PEP_ID=MMETSP0113_2-20130426/6996_1 /TAXON_ID=91329 /ORGANISM="Norrisiella sphaerica, Strain BC52" /LENGTH=709 /DNA_ID=CAMNT_0026866805 /DNA_START=342 /DNA_END=2471 /DNA_ORIENTATION=-